MGKKKREGNLENTTGGRDARDVQRVIRRLGLIESNQSLDAWYAQARMQLPEASVQRFYDFKTGKRDADIYDLTYKDFDHARVFHVSWSSQAFETELTWMIPRLRAALSRVEPERRFFIELGSGHGAAAAVVSAVLKVPVIAVDPQPAAFGLPELFAARTGGDVTSITASAKDLPGVVDGRIPAAIFGLGVFRYFQTHEHGNDSFSFMNAMDHMFATRMPDAQSLAFFQANTPAEMIFSESGCPDYLAEVLLGARAAGYNLSMGGAAVKKESVASGELRDLLMFHLTTKESLISVKHPFIEMSQPLPELHAGLSVEGTAAEAIRLVNNPDITTIETTEVEFSDGTLNTEIFTIGDHFAGLYKTSNLGYRSIKIVPYNELPRIQQDEDRENENFTDNQEALIRRLVLRP
jgi:hypothetical protein